MAARAKSPATGGANKAATHTDRKHSHPSGSALYPNPAAGVTAPASTSIPRRPSASSVAAGFGADKKQSLFGRGSNSNPAAGTTATAASNTARAGAAAATAASAAAATAANTNTASTASSSASSSASASVGFSITPKTSATAAGSRVLRYRGARLFRTRVVCATLAGRTLRIDDIRALDASPGLRDYEASFLRLMEKITNGCTIQINETGTQLRYKPGLIVGGSGITHDCPNSRSVGYFLESLIALAPFAKKPLSIVLRGVTNSDLDTSVDVFRTVTIPVLKHFGIDDGCALKIRKRGAPPGGGGEIHFTCPIVKELKSIDVTDEGRIKRIRGIVYTAHGAAANANRVATAARSVFNNLLPDVYLYTDHYTKKNAGPSPGAAVSVVAQTTSGCLLSAQATSVGSPDFEQLGLTAANLLCEEISRGGCIDTSHQSLVLLLMLLTPEDVSRVRTGPLSPHTIQCLRHYRDIFGVTFKVRADRAKADLAADLERETAAAAAAAKEKAEAEAADAAEAAAAAAGDGDGDADMVNDKGTRRASKKQRRLAEKDAKRAAEAAKKNIDVSAAASQSAYTVVLSCLGIGYKNINRKTA